MMKTFVLLFSTCLFLSCTDPKEIPPPPEGALHKDKFAQVMIDVQLLEGMKIHKIGPKKGKNIDMTTLYAEVFEKHQISKEEFELTYDYYKSHPQKMEEIYEQVLDSLATIELEVKKEFNRDQSDEVDTLNQLLDKSDELLPETPQ